MEKIKKDKIAIINMQSCISHQVFEETKTIDFRLTPLNDILLNQKLYVYSSRKDKAIIGFIRVSRTIYGTIEEIVSETNYNNQDDLEKTIEQFGDQKIYGLELYDVTEFDRYLTLDMLRDINNSFFMKDYIKYINSQNRLYKVITDWDEAFSLDGSLCKNPDQTEARILGRGKRKR